jgi:hypothetical protein
MWCYVKWWPDYFSSPAEPFQLWPSNARFGRFVKGFGEDEAGEIYVLSTPVLGPTGQTGDVRRLAPP